MSENDQNETTVLVHLENAAEGIGNALQEYMADNIPREEVERQLHAASPKLEDIGAEIGEDYVKVNNKPVPDNPLGVVYFYTDEEGTLKATIRLPNYGDEAVLNEEDHAHVAEMAALEVLRLVNQEHQRVIQRVVMSSLLSSQLTKNDDEDDDDPLSSIEDESTKAQVRSFMKH